MIMTSIQKEKSCRATKWVNLDKKILRQKRRFLDDGDDANLVEEEDGEGGVDKNIKINDF